jgi:predicted ester cyclase
MRPTTATTRSAAVDLCVRHLTAMATGTPEEFARMIHAEAVNHEAAAEPPAARQPGWAGFYATARWLRAAFTGLSWAVHAAVEAGDLVVLHCTMYGRHTGDFVTYRAHTATVDTVMPPTGKSFAVTQTHWFRLRDHLIAEHWANRDDLAMAKQAGWVPPSPVFLLRAAIARWRAGRRTGEGVT